MARPSEFTNSYYQQIIKSINVAGTLMPLILVWGGFLARNGILDNRFYAGDTYYVTISAIFLVLAMANFYLISIRKNMSLPVFLGLSICYHVVGIAYLLFVVGMTSPFVIIWIMLIVAIDTYFGVLSTLLSLTTMFLTIVGFFWLYPFLTINDKSWALFGFLFVASTTLMLSRLRAITDRERRALGKTRDQSNFQRGRLLALVNSMGDAVVTTDEAGRIKVYNAATLSLLDTNADLEGKNLDDVLQLRDKMNHRVQIVSEAIKKRLVFSRTDVTHKFGKDDAINLYVNVAPVQPSYRAGGERGFIFILRDITKEKTLEQERDEFISVVSHELRTPVTIAEGGISNIMLMQDRGASPEVLKQAATAAHDQILYLSKLINDLSALSRAERGLGAEVEVVDLTELLHTLFSNNQAQAEAKGLQLNLDMPAHLPKVVSSRLYIEEIMQNLMTNALKYTREGSITIRGSVYKGAPSLAIADTGIGISKADQKHIFEKFYRSEDYRTRESSGTGLGLYVCQKLAEKIGLKLTFESRLNHGSTFTLAFPKQAAPAEGQQPAAPAAVAAPTPDSTHSALSN